MSDLRRGAPTRLLVIGASYLQLPLILKAREMGIETHVFAWEEGAVAREHCDFFYPISIVEKEAILAEAGRIQPHGVVSIGSDLATVTVNYVASNLGLIGHSMEVTQRTTNKYLMRQTLAEHELPCPQFRCIRHATELQSLHLNYPLIVKPTDRSGSRGVTKVLDPKETPNAVQRAISHSFAGEAIVEEFVEGREISVETISWQGKHYFLAVTDKVTTGPPFFVEMEHHQPSTIPSEMQDKVFCIVDRALTCLGVQYGAAHSELLITSDDRAYIVEIGARMGGDFIGSHLVVLSTGYDFVKGVIQVCLGEFQCVTKAKSRCSGVYYITAGAGCVAGIIDRTNSFSEIVERAVFSKTGDVISGVQHSADRVGYYIYQSDERFVPDVHPLEIVLEAQRESQM